jgi:hypothetical protein
VPRLTTAILSPFIFLSVILIPLYHAGNINDPADTSYIRLPEITRASEPASLSAQKIYDSLKLGKAGLNKDAFFYALAGYEKLNAKGLLSKKGIITICDFSQSSKKKRLYLLDLNKFKILLNTYVAHGRNSGMEYPNRFSNKPESLQSSLGFYVTRKTYYGSHGLALTIAGLEKDINDKAERRKIVVHGSEYIGDNYLRFSKYMGRSFGCPAIPKKYTGKLIHTIKNGSCLFIYHPSKNYLSASKILNG